MTEETLEKLMWRNTAWRYNHRNGLELESFHGLDRDIQLFYMLGRLLAAEHQPPTPQTATSTELLAAIGERRKSIALRIAANPEQFCVCEGCGFILKLPVSYICRNCHGYSFDHSRERVLEMAAISGSKSSADGCAMIPRYAAQVNTA